MAAEIWLVCCGEALGAGVSDESEATLALWRAAATAVQTDPEAALRPRQPPPCTSFHLSVKRWKRFQIQEAARRSIPRRSALSGSSSDSLIAPSLHHHRHLLPSPTSSFLCFTPLMNSAAHFKEAAVIKAQRDSQDHSNLYTLERLNKRVSVICCPCIGGFSLDVFFLFIYLFFFWDSYL